MKLSISLVAVKKIVSNKPRSIYKDDEIEQAAKLILDSQGLVNPLIVQRTSLQSYEVVDGDFEYYAAARAREIDPRKGEMIGVFIVEPETEENIINQVKVFRKSGFENSEPTKIISEDLEKFLNNFESRFEKVTKQLLEESINKVNLEMENKALKKKLAEQIKPLKIFQDLNADKIAKKLLNAGFNHKKAAQIAGIIVNEREKKQFNSLEDVIERVKVPYGKKMQKAISQQKMLDIVESLFVED